MAISKNKVVLIDYILKDNDGNIIDSSDGREPLAYIHGTGSLIPGLESALDGKTVGDKIKTKIQPEDAYGTRDEKLKQVIALDSFDNPDDIKKGVQLQIESEKGIKYAFVTEVKGNEVSIDLNHPLAGVELNFDVEIKGVRDASQEELSHGHVHGEGGHHH